MKRFSRAEIVGGLLTAVAIVAIAVGLFLLGSPTEERARRLDERRVDDLAALARAVDLYWSRNGRLPSSLEELRSEPGGNVSSTDPSTNAQYEYRPLEAGTYELCAHFERDSPPPGRAISEGFWSHGSGRHCFRREARKIG